MAEENAVINVDVVVNTQGAQQAVSVMKRMQNDFVAMSRSMGEKIRASLSAAKQKQDTSSYSKQLISSFLSDLDKLTSGSTKSLKEVTDLINHMAGTADDLEKSFNTLRKGQLTAGDIQFIESVKEYVKVLNQIQGASVYLDSTATGVAQLSSVLNSLVKQYGDATKAAELMGETVADAARTAATPTSPENLGTGKVPNRARLAAKAAADAIKTEEPAAAAKQDSAEISKNIAATNQYIAALLRSAASNRELSTSIDLNIRNERAQKAAVQQSLDTLRAKGKLTQEEADRLRSAIAAHDENIAKLNQEKAAVQQLLDIENINLDVIRQNTQAVLEAAESSVRSASSKQEQVGAIDLAVSSLRKEATELRSIQSLLTGLYGTESSYNAVVTESAGAIQTAIGQYTRLRSEMSSSTTQMLNNRNAILNSAKVAVAAAQAVQQNTNAERSSIGVISMSIKTLSSKRAELLRLAAELNKSGGMTDLYRTEISELITEIDISKKALTDQRTELIKSQFTTRETGAAISDYADKVRLMYDALGKDSGGLVENLSGSAEAIDGINKSSSGATGSVSGLIGVLTKVAGVSQVLAGLAFVFPDPTPINEFIAILAQAVAVLAALGPIIDFIVKLLKTLWSIVSAVTKAFYSLAKTVVSAVTGAFKALGGFLSGIVEKLTGIRKESKEVGKNTSKMFGGSTVQHSYEVSRAIDIFQSALQGTTLAAALLRGDILGIVMSTYSLRKAILPLFALSTALSMAFLSVANALKFLAEQMNTAGRTAQNTINHFTALTGSTQDGATAWALSAHWAIKYGRSLEETRGSMSDLWRVGLLSNDTMQASIALAGAWNVSLTEASNAVAQMIGEAEASSDTMRRYGIVLDDVTLATDRTARSTQITDAIMSRFGKSVQYHLMSLEGSLERLKSASQFFWEAFMEPFTTKAAAPVLLYIGNIVAELANLIMGLWNSSEAQVYFNKTLSMAKQIVEDFAPEIEFLGNILKTVVAAAFWGLQFALRLAVQGLREFFLWLRNVFSGINSLGRVVKPLVDALRLLSNAWKSMTPTSLLQAFKNLFYNLPPWLRAIFDILKVGFDLVVWAITEFLVKPAQRFINGFLDEFAKAVPDLQQLLVDIAETFKEALPIIQEFLGPLAEFMQIKAEIIGRVLGFLAGTIFQGILGLIQTVLLWITGDSDQIVDLWSGIWDSIKERFSSLEDELRPLFDQATEAFWEFYGNIFGDQAATNARESINQLWEDIKAAYAEGSANGGGVGGGLSNVWTNVIVPKWEEIKGLLDAWWENDFKPWLQALYDKISPVLLDAWEAFSAAAKSIWDKFLRPGLIATWNKFKSWISGTWNTYIKPGIESAWDAFKNWIATELWPNYIAPALDKAWAGVTLWLGDLSRGIGYAIGHTIVDMLTFSIWDIIDFFYSGKPGTSIVSAIINGIISAMARVWISIVHIGYNLLLGIIEGFVGGIADWQDMIDFLIDEALAIFGIESPSKVFTEIGENLMLGLLDGIDSLIGDVIEVITSAFDDFKNKYWTPLKSAVVKIWNDLWSAAETISNTIDQYVIQPIRTQFDAFKDQYWTPLKETVSQIWTDLWTAIEDLAELIDENIISKIRGFFNMFKDEYWPGIKTALTGIWSDLWGIVEKTASTIKARVIDPIIGHFTTFRDETWPGLIAPIRDFWVSIFGLDASKPGILVQAFDWFKARIRVLINELTPILNPFINTLAWIWSTLNDIINKFMPALGGIEIPDKNDNDDDPPPKPETFTGGVFYSRQTRSIAEHGPEAVIPLSFGSVPVMMTGGGFGGSTNIQVVITGNTIANELDVEEIADKVAAQIQRRLSLHGTTATGRF